MSLARRSLFAGVPPASVSSSPAPSRRWRRQARWAAGQPDREARPPSVPARWSTTRRTPGPPAGFQYEIVTYAGRTKLEDGKGDTPSNHDGTAVFEGRRGRLLLIQNHELSAGSPSACRT